MEDDDEIPEGKDPEIVETPDRMVCPRCGSSDIRRSGSEGWMVTIIQALGRWGFRCRSCRHRFFRPNPPPPER